MTRERVLYGETIFETLRDDSEPLILSQDDWQYLFDNNIDFILVVDECNKHKAIIITSTYDEGNELFMKRFGPRQVIYELSN